MRGNVPRTVRGTSNASVFIYCTHILMDGYSIALSEEDAANTDTYGRVAGL
jgi:hypothetical protein